MISRERSSPGYPNWWSDMPMILYTFFDSYDFSGKTIAPFCTSGGSGRFLILPPALSYLPSPVRTYLSVTSLFRPLRQCRCCTLLTMKGSGKPGTRHGDYDPGRGETLARGKGRQLVFSHRDRNHRAGFQAYRFLSFLLIPSASRRENLTSRMYLGWGRRIRRLHSILSAIPISTR